LCFEKAYLKNFIKLTAKSAKSKVNQIILEAIKEEKKLRTKEQQHGNSELVVKTTNYLSFGVAFEIMRLCCSFVHQVFDQI